MRRGGKEYEESKSEGKKRKNENGGEPRKREERKGR